MKYFLFPFAVLFDLITTVRNFLYDRNLFYFKSQKFDAYTISVGNLSVGGTGKTPFIEYLIRLLNNKYKVATLSRGYGRKTKGIIIAKKTSTAEEIGDEPMQFLHKFFPKVHVMVGEERSIAIPHLLSRHPETQIVLLDDAFQHRKVNPDFNILLTDFNNLFFKDYLLPMGRLRENRKGVKRAQAIVVTKCPEDIGYKKEYIIQKLKRYVDPAVKPIYFTGIKYGIPIHFSDPNLVFDFSSKIILVTGLANASSLQQYVDHNFKLVTHFDFPDHHHYSMEDFEKIVTTFKKVKTARKCIITTEKDIMKWNLPAVRQVLGKLPVFYIPIEMYFLENEGTFQKMLLKGLK